MSRQTFRSERYPEYKANRSSTPDEFHGQIDITKEVLAALGITVLAEPGFEADDLIATLATQAENEGYRVLVVTGDRDSLQLVSDDVTVLYPRKGVSELTRFTPEAVVEKYGLTPDAVPGLRRAARRSQRQPARHSRGGGEDRRRNGSSSTARCRGWSTTSTRCAARSATRCARIWPAWCSTASSPTWSKMCRWRRRRTRCGCSRGIATRFTGSSTTWSSGCCGTGCSTPWPPSSPRSTRVSTCAAARWSPARSGSGWPSTPATGAARGLAVVGTHLPYDGDATALAIAAADGDGGYIDTATLTPDDDAALAAWLADPAKPKALHEAKLAIHDLAGRGWTLNGVTSDTALAAYLVRPGQRSFTLDDLSLRYLRRELRAETPEQQQLSLLDDMRRDRRASRPDRDPAGPGRGGPGRRAGHRAGPHRLHRLLADMELPVQRVLADMETAGIAVDLRLLTELQSQFGDQIRDAAEAAYAVIGKQINLGSPKQLQVVLFDELEMPKTKRTKTGYTTDADALQSLFDKTGHPFLQHLLAHRDVTRLKVTVDGLLNSVADDGRIHTTFNQTIAATGRLSSTEPNLQNIPIRTDAGRQIRDAFVVGGGYAELMTADYSQIEMRIMAHLSRDEGLIEAFNTGEDLHSFVASRAFGVPIEEVTAELRRRVKAMSYGLAYGLSAYGLSAAAEDLHRGGEGPDGPVLRPVRRGARLSDGRRRAGPQGRLHLDGAGPPPLPARAGQQQSPGARGRRAGGAQRADPGQRGRHHQGGHDRGRQGDQSGRAGVADAAAGTRRVVVRDRAR